jgi:hypothetical protein
VVHTNVGQKELFYEIGFIFCHTKSEFKRVPSFTVFRNVSVKFRNYDDMRELIIRVRIVQKNQINPLRPRGNYMNHLL